MKLSAAKVARKCTYGLSGCDQTAIGLVLTLGLFTAPAEARLTTPRVPLPMARPAEAPAREPAAKPSDTEAPAATDKPAAAQSPAASPGPTPCRVALTESIAIAPSIADIHGPAACGGTDIVRLDAIVLPDNTKVPLKPAATMRCTMASAVADWIRTDMAPLAGSLGTRLSELDNFDSFDCRGRNRVVGAKMSEHGRANALDVRALKLANGQSIALTEKTTPRDLRDKVLQSVCARFTTVLGPGSDGYHEDHVHLDLAERRNNYRICQWEVWDPMPVVAPLLPAERPAEAPPRDVADAGDGKGAAVAVETKPAESPPAEAAPAVAAPVAEPAPEQKPAAAAVAPAKPKAKPKARPRRRNVRMPSPFNIFR
jgi:hypothetical protein